MTLGLNLGLGAPPPLVATPKPTETEVTKPQPTKQPTNKPYRLNKVASKLATQIKTNKDNK